MQSGSPARPQAAIEPSPPALVGEAMRLWGRLLDAPVAADGEDISAQFAETLDRSRRYFLSRFTLGLSPKAVVDAYFDWLAGLAVSPGKQLQLAEKAARKSLRLVRYAATCALEPGGGQRCIEPLPNDRRFAAEEWKEWPFNVMHQAFLLQQQWWHNATTGVGGVTRAHERQVTFMVRQMLDMMSPSNFWATNPTVLRRTAAEGGMNLVRGAANLLEDWERAINRRPPPGAEAFVAGREVAATPGKVVFRNRLMELIQYAPATREVRPEPVLIVPAWIMKYYILDLEQKASLVRYLTEQGFTVFMISWKNPTAEDRDLGMEDYSLLGVEAALSAVSHIVPDRDVHAVGYCLGGTLLAIAAAARARENRNTFKTLSFLAAQTDFEDAGELTLFISEPQVEFLEAMMWEQGTLASHQMAGAFRMLRSNDLIWSRGIHDYLMGERSPLTALTAWNADATRMPARMHSEYLRSLFLDNDLAHGRFKVAGRPVALTDIRAPVFAVGTETDHVAPWRSVFKFHLLLDTSLTFLLTSGGHNTGIVSEPGRAGRRYRVRTRHEPDTYVDPDAWLATTETKAGSWWPEWAAWLAELSGPPTAPPAIGAPGAGLPPLADAPGIYVLQK